MTIPRIAVVVQRYGPDVHGGAESAARWLAENLAAHLPASVHVLTTCANDYTTWENVYPAGQSQLNGVHIYRFPVDKPRNWQRSQQETGRFLLGERSVEAEIDWIRREGPFSSDLLRHVAAHQEKYDVFIFFTYLYATTFFALPLVAHKAILIPAAHDEPFLYMDAYRTLLQLPRHIVFLTAAEKELVQRVALNAHIPATVTAIGLHNPDVSTAAVDAFRRRHELHGNFLLYGGRISEAKNVTQLLDYFLRYNESRRHDPPLKLALMGRPHMPIPSHPHIRPLGFISDEEKFVALKAATVSVLPSIFESLSIMILESWLMETPVLVNGRSAVLRQQVRHSNGGLYYNSYEEFAAALDLMLAQPALRHTLGRQGRRFVTARYSRDAILNQYRKIIDSLITF